MILRIPLQKPLSYRTSRTVRVQPIRALSPEMSRVLIEQSYLIGKTTILFVGFYTSLNWLYYYSMRKQNEKDKKK